MPDVQVAFIDPAVLQAKLEPAPLEATPVAELGPSPSHQIEIEPQEVPILTPIVGLDPGPPPQFGEGHYANVLDEIWPEFDDPDERTVVRVRSLLHEVKREAGRVHLLAQQVWAKIPKWKVEDSERERFNKEFSAYTRRLIDYQKALLQLEPLDEAPDEVYIGLIKRAAGAGPVPDAIMHLYFADQLGILAEHADTLGEDFVGRVIDALAVVDTKIEEGIDDLADAEREIQEGFEEAANKWAKGIERGLLIVGGVLMGSVLLIGGTVAIAATAIGKARGSDGD